MPKSLNSTNLELQGISDTCKLLGLENYDPVKFIELIRTAYSNIADMEISMSNYGDKYDNARVYFWRETTKQIKDNLGRILLQLDKQTADETIEAEIYARDLSRD